MNEAGRLEELIAAVQSGPKYAVLHPDLVRAVAEIEITKGRSFKETVKAVRNKLHQVGGAYQETPIGYAQAARQLALMPHDLASPDLREFCRNLMRQHASTRERLPILDDFYQDILSGFGPIHSLLDLACGLNPLALPWINLTPDAQVYACDIYQDMIDFINQFYLHLGLRGQAELCDLTQQVPQHKVQLALLLKTIPCLEQLDKSIGNRLLQTIPAEHILVSFPARSLGGRNKGMVENYEAHFMQLISGQDWHIQRFEFSTELAFLISRPTQD